MLAKFDYGGGDQNGLTARVASLETLLANIKAKLRGFIRQRRQTCSKAQLP